MDCCLCFGGWKKKGKQWTGRPNKVHPLSPDHRPDSNELESRKWTSPAEEAGDRETSPWGPEATLSPASKISKDGYCHTAARAFTLHELSSATNNFSADCLLNTGDHYRLYKGVLENTNQLVAIKLLHRNRLQQRKEFLVEISMQSALHHENVVDLIGYCDHGDKKLLVFEYMPLGSLADHLHGSISAKTPLCWSTRMRIAAGLAKGLEYLHDRADPPVIYHNLRSSNVLLGDGYQPKLANFGLSKLAPYEGERNMDWGRVWDSQTCAYCAPEYFMTGRITPKSDIYSFGVVLLELITGKKAFDHSRATGNRLAAWASPLLKDARKYRKMVDPGLKGQYPFKRLYQAFHVAAMCLQENPRRRPPAADLVTVLTYLASEEYEPDILYARSGHLAPRTAPRSTSRSGEKQSGCSDHRDQAAEIKIRNGTEVPNS
ncbi:probable serine/threonine-protein kinase PBL7 [Nymphaea colorata]|nr:probable serine/threonine-protein kinase PBL7 [Nymphaea colorata]XP_031477030.1 probable serine/threonine-protein kinase PBL7 [Nymphaea colorata]